jgi:hypothetical protein
LALDADVFDPEPEPAPDHLLNKETLPSRENMAFHESIPAETMRLRSSPPGENPRSQEADNAENEKCLKLQNTLPGGMEPKPH